MFDTTREPDDARFHICDDSSADWLLKQLAAIDAEIALIDGQAKAAVRRLQADRQNLERLFGSELESYIRQRIQHDKRNRKSVILPHGTCAFRTVPGGLRLADIAVAMAHAQEQTGGYTSLLDYAPTLNTTAYRELAAKRYEDTGELLPGMEDTPDREQFSIRFAAHEVPSE